jgi:hypothetical protein
MEIFFFVAVDPLGGNVGRFPTVVFGSDVMTGPAGKLLPFVLFAAALGCQESPSAATLSPTSPAARYLSSDTALGVTIYGPAKVLSESTVNYSASVSGGSGSYLYYWIAEVCYLDGYCRAPQVFAHGQGVSSVSRLIRGDEAEVNIAVQVRESSEVHKSGVDDVRVLGPATWQQGHISGSWGCRAPSHFPHVEHDIYYVNGLVIDVVGNYARGCNGERINAPDSGVN